MTEITCGKLIEGPCQIVLSVTPPDFLHWDLTISINGSDVAQHAGLLALLAMAPFQGIDIGIDSKSPVNWRIFADFGNFPYTGLLHSVSYKPGDLSDFAGSKWIDFLKEEGRKYE